MDKDQIEREQFEAWERIMKEMNPTPQYAPND